MASAIPQGELAEIVREARARTGVPAVAAGLLVDGDVELAADGARVDTPFRVASITKWFTASLAGASGVLDARTRALLSHTADLRSEAPEALPDACRGLWSYSNAGYWAAGDACATAAGSSFSDAMRARILEPLGLTATSFEEPADAAEGHVQEGQTGHRAAGLVDYPVSRRPSGGLWSTVGDLLRFAEHQFGDPHGLQQPQAKALGAEYCLGCWRRELEGDRIAFEHEGSVGGYQSLLLLVPEERAALVVLTNSWRGSGLIRRVAKALGLVPASDSLFLSSTGPIEPGRYRLGGAEAVVEEVGDGWRVGEAETDPLTDTRIERGPYAVEPIGGGVYGFAGGLLMGHRIDFPRPGIARVGWVAMPRAEP
ncbi:MAG: serine hydrolase domain-containing protein [Gaiellaceae bacterium]